MYKKYFKRILDILISSGTIVVLWPIYLITAIAIKLDSKGPVIFKQTRLGKDHKEFNMYKFRSYGSDSDQQGKDGVGRQGERSGLFLHQRYPENPSLRRREQGLL